MDSKMDVDVGKIPEAHHLSPTQDPGAIPTLDGWIENLMNCKQLTENDVSRLCDRVRVPNTFRVHALTVRLGERSVAGGIKCTTSGKYQTFLAQAIIRNDESPRNARSLSVVIFMVNSTISWNSSELEAPTQIRITSSWVCDRERNNWYGSADGHSR